MTALEPDDYLCLPWTQNSESFFPHLCLFIVNNYYNTHSILEALLRVKEQWNILREISKRKANCIGHILRRNCLLQQVTGGKVKGGIEITGRRGKRRRKLLDDLKERRGYSHLKEEALDRTMWRPRSGRGFRPVARETTK
jgi:hypothetical protein